MVPGTFFSGTLLQKKLLDYMAVKEYELTGFEWTAWPISDKNASKKSPFALLQSME